MIRKKAIALAIAFVIFGLAFLVASASPAMAQQPEEQVSVPKSMLTKDQLDAIAQQNMKDKVERYGKWVGIGHEVGQAVNESLSAITTQANNFAQTPVGKWTIVVVIYKVIGQQLTGLVIGVGTLLIGLPLWIWSYRKYLPHRIVTERTYDNSKFFRRVVTEKFTVVNEISERDSAANWYRAMHFVFLILLFGLSMWVIFGS